VSPTEATSLGPVSVTYAFRSRLLLEVPGREAEQCRVTSRRELAGLLEDHGLTAAEATSIAERLWAARPGDAASAPLDPWDTFAASTGLSRWKLLLVVSALVVGVATLVTVLAR